MGPNFAVNSVGGEEVVEAGAVGIVELGEEGFEAFGVAEGEDEVEVHGLGSGESVDGSGFAGEGDLTHMTG